MKEVEYRYFIGANLRVAREVIGLSQIKMAEKYNLGQSKLSQWERGIYYPDPWFLYILCDDYNLTMDWFYRRVPAGVGASLVDGLRRARVDIK